jgi:hypothetical protein
MSCPEWEYCNQPKCHSRHVCQSKAYWRRYWASQGQIPEKAKEPEFPPLPSMIDKCDSCNKKAACELLSQCVMDRFKNKPLVLEKIQGAVPIKEIVKILAAFYPDPMKSYYPVIHKRINKVK